MRENSELTYLFVEALNWAVSNTLGSKRKKSNVPGASHPLGVAALVMDYGGSEDEVIAALLHDEAEDRGGEKTLVLIENRFGKKVAQIVRECSDALPENSDDKEDWQPRKEKHLAELPKASDSSHFVYLADKIHNLRALVIEYSKQRDDIWTAFKGGKDGTLWYYGQLIKIFEASKAPTLMVKDLERAYDDLVGLIEENAG